MGVPTALGTVVTLAETSAHQMVKTGFLGQESCLKLAEHWGFRVHTHYMAYPLT